MKRFALWWLRRRGWTIVGDLPDVPRYVAIGAPHTSNLDFLSFLAVVHHFRIPAYFIGKHTLFRWPFGGLMRRLGGVPVRRGSGQGLVEQVVAEFGAHDRMALVIAPEGTRSRAEGWRSGFYRIAREAGVPVVLAFVDSSRRQAGIGPTLHLTGDITADMNRIRAFYADKVGERPDNTTPVRMADEE